MAMFKQGSSGTNVVLVGVIAAVGLSVMVVVLRQVAVRKPGGHLVAA